MKTFADVKFKINEAIPGICGTIDLNNGYEISVIMVKTSAGGNKGLWEVAVFPVNSAFSISMKCFDNRDFIGFLTFNELEEKIIEIQKEFKKKSKIFKKK